MQGQGRTDASSLPMCHPRTLRLAKCIGGGTVPSAVQVATRCEELRPAAARVRRGRYGQGRTVGATKRLLAGFSPPCRRGAHHQRVQGGLDPRAAHRPGGRVAEPIVRPGRHCPACRMAIAPAGGPRRRWPRCCQSAAPNPIRRSPQYGPPKPCPSRGPGHRPPAPTRPRRSKQHSNCPAVFGPP